jgi:hypothetical protein
MQQTYPAKVFDDPDATAVHPATESPTRPHPLPLTNTVELPAAMGATCPGQGLPGNRCPVLISP